MSGFSTIFTGKPIVILATGQSNIAIHQAYTWVAPPNLYLWDWDSQTGDTATDVGSSYAIMPNDRTSVARSFAAAVAEVNPTARVVLVNIGIGSLPISKWMTGGPDPDMYAAAKANVEAALTLLGVSTIDHFLWWQGESNAGSSTYAADFETVIARFRTETWFPRHTPITIMGLSPYTASSGVTAISNQLRVRAEYEPMLRSFVDTGSLPIGYWQGADYYHMTALGYHTAGRMAFQVAFSGRSISRFIGAGDNQYIFTANLTGQLLDLKSGTAASPNTSVHPLVKATRLLEWTDNTGGGDGGENYASILGICVGTAASKVQPVGVYGAAKASGTDVSGAQARPDACGLYGFGRITGSGAGVGIGAFLAGQRDNDTGKVTAVEMQVRNYGTANGGYNPTGFSTVTGNWMTVVGNADAGAAYVIGNPSGRQFDVGLAVPAQVNGGKTGGVKTATFRDDGNAITSIDIRGSRTYGIDLMSGTYSSAAIRIGSGASTYTGIRARNAANSADMSILSVNASDQLIVGGSVSSIFIGQTVYMQDAKNIEFNATTGTKLGGNATQKLAFWGATPIVRPTGVAVTAAGIHAALVSIGLIAA